MEKARITAAPGNALNAPGKAPYKKPVLTVFGSVRELTRGAIGTASDTFGFKKLKLSDRRLKENIVRIGVHPLGIGIYLFDYKECIRDEWGSGRQFGVMADEVEDIIPEAVALRTDGFKAVDYARLGVFAGEI